MTPEEYKQKTKELKWEYNKKQRAIDMEYALSNSPAKIGDILAGHCQTIEYQMHDLSRPGILNNLPCLYYHGKKLTKNGKPFKSGEHGTIWQLNLKKVNGVSI